MIPIQKLGIDWPSIENVVIDPSHAVPRLIAARTPKGIARISASTIEKTVSSIVAGSASSTICIAGWRYESDWPKSPRARSPPTKLRYCSCRGRSKPSARRVASISSCEARSLTKR